MFKCFACALSCIGWLATSSVYAQSVSVPAANPAPPSDVDTSADKSNTRADNDIVVTGRREVPSETFHQAVKKFVRGLGRPGPINQISRWGESVCPKTTGLSPGFNDHVTKRIKEIAIRVGVPGSGDCRKNGNVLVVFTTKPDQFMADVRDHHEGLLGYHYVGQTKSLATFQPPMKSWYVTMSIIPGAYAAFDQAYAPSPPGRTGSRIRPPLKSRFAFALVVIDSNLLDGQAIGPVADKIAMLVLSAPTLRDGCNALPSIMDYLEPSCSSGGSMEGLTAYDEAFLKGLYAFDRDELKSYMRETISKRVNQEASLPPPSFSGQ